MSARDRDEVDPALLAIAKSLKTTIEDSGCLLFCLTFVLVRLYRL